MRHLLVGIWLLLCSVTSAYAQVSLGVGIGLPGVSIGINLPLYPVLVRVPGYPVYYAPQVNSNFFFYDGMYWVYESDNWYASSWYNGPWGLVNPQYVPLFVLRIPVRYYRAPPAYFRDWRSNAPPRWGDHWGRDWEQHRSGWNQWNRRASPAPAPLPVYQRQYSGDRYPQQIERQQTLRSENYRYQPRDPAVRQHDQQQRPQQRPAPEPVPRGQTGSTPDRDMKPQAPQQHGTRADEQRGPASAQQTQRPPRGSEKQDQHPPGPTQRETSPREGRPQQESNRGQGPGKDNDRGEGRGR